MKKLKTIIIMLLLLVVLIIVYLFASPLWRENEGEVTTEAPGETIAAIDHKLLVGLEITAGDKKLSFSLNDTSTAWVWSENGEVPLDNVAFATIVTEFNEAKSSFKLDGVTETQIAEYGLSEPSFIVRFSLSDDSEKEYRIGNFNSFNSLYYLADAADMSTVYMVNSALKESIDLEIYDFVLEETPPAITEGKIVGVDYLDASEYRDYVFYPSGNNKDYTDKYNWYYRTGLTQMSILPPELPLDGSMADTLTELITELSFEKCVGLDDSDEKYGFSDSKKIIVRYNADEGETGVLTEKKYVIYLGAQTESGEIYVHTEDSKLVYLLSSSDEWIEILTSDKEKLLPDEIWLPNYERVDSLIFKAAGNTLTVNVKNTDGKITYSSTASDESDAIAALITKLDDLKATSNVAYLKDEDTDVEKELLLAVKIAFNAGEYSDLEMEITRYSRNYCLVKFGLRNDQLITLEDAEALIGLITELTKAD